MTNILEELSAISSCFPRPLLLFEFYTRFFDMPFPMVDLLLDWRNAKKISEAVFSKVARENAVKLLALE